MTREQWAEAYREARRFHGEVGRRLRAELVRDNSQLVGRIRGRIARNLAESAKWRRVRHDDSVEVLNGWRAGTRNRWAREHARERLEWARTARLRDLPEALELAGLTP